MCWIVLEIVGWDTSKRSAKSSSVRLWRRVRRVIFRVWFRLRARGLVAGLFQVRFLFRAVVRVANCAWVSPVVRLLCNGLFWWW